MKKCIFNSLVNEFDSTRYEVGKVFKLDNVFHITEKREDGQHIEVLVGINNDTHCVCIQGVKDGIVFGGREFTWWRWISQEDIDRIIDWVKDAFEGIHNYMDGAHEDELNILREKFNETMTEMMRDEFKAKVEFVRENTNNFIPEKMKYHIVNWSYSRIWGWDWGAFVSKHCPTLRWEAKAYYTFNVHSFFDDKWVCDRIREWSWENQVVYSTQSYEGPDGFDCTAISITGNIDISRKKAHKLGYNICQYVHNIINNENDTDTKIVIDKDFFCDKDFKFLSKGRNLTSTMMFIYKYGKFIGGDHIHSVDVDKDSVIVKLYANYVQHNHLDNGE